MSHFYSNPEDQPEYSKKPKRSFKEILKSFKENISLSISTSPRYRKKC